MPSIKRIPKTIIPITPKIQLKELFKITKNTMANKINVAPSFHIRMNLEVY